MFCQVSKLMSGWLRQSDKNTKREVARHCRDYGVRSRDEEEIGSGVDLSLLTAHNPCRPRAALAHTQRLVAAFSSLLQ